MESESIFHLIENVEVPEISRGTKHDKSLKINSPGWESWHSFSAGFTAINKSKNKVHACILVGAQIISKQANNCSRQIQTVKS